MCLTSEEKASILVVLSAVACADSYSEGFNAQEYAFLEKVQGKLQMSGIDINRYKELCECPGFAYQALEKGDLSKKRFIKALMLKMATLDGPINEGEQTSLDLLDKICKFPVMSLAEMNDELSIF